MAKKSHARILKEKGLIPKDWDLRKPLTTGQKSWITKQSNKYKAVISRPKDFSFRPVSKATAEQFKKSGYLTSGNRVILPTRNQKVKIKRGSLEITKPGQIERVILSGNGEKFLKKLDQLQGMKLKKNQSFGLKIGSSSTIDTMSPSINDLMAYARRMNLKSSIGSSQVSIVVITVTDRPGIVGHNPLNDEDDEDGEEFA